MLVNKWLYQHKEISSLDDILKIEPNAIGFIYKITNRGLNKDHDKFYIGKKALEHHRKTKITKKEKLTTGTRKKSKRISKDSGWLDYYGSSLELKADIKKYGVKNFKREILTFCTSKKELSYRELEMQVKLDVLVENSYNGNVAGKFYRKDLNI